jgi:DNA-binding NarL/FixJ family response regulator
MKRRPIRVLCVDDHEFLVKGLIAQFEQEGDLESVGRLESAAHLIEEARRLRPDIVLLDLEMPGPDPFEAAADLQRHCPEARVIILSAYVRDHYISAAYEVGVWGYFSKSDDAAEITAGIRRVAAGEFAAGPKVRQRLRPDGKQRRPLPPPPRSSRLEALTPREREILRLIGRGLTRTEIARQLCRSAKTIDSHRVKIMRKLDIHDRGDLVRFAIGEGMVEV